MDSNSRGDNPDITSCVYQYEDYHTEYRVSTHAEQLMPGVPAHGEDVAGHTGRKTEISQVSSTGTQHTTQIYSPTQLAALSSTCECRPTAVRPFRCGLCCKAYSTICKLHEHLEYAHREHEMYLFDKITQTAFPRYESSSVATQTEAEIEQHEGDAVDRIGGDFGNAEQEVNVPGGEFKYSANALDEKEYSGRKATERDYCSFVDDDSKVLNTYEDVVVKTEVLSMDFKTDVFSSDDEYTPQSEKRSRLSFKKKKKSRPYTVKRKTEQSKSRCSKTIIKKLKTKPSKTLTSKIDKTLPKTLTSDVDKAFTSDVHNTEQDASTSDYDSFMLFKCRYCNLEFSSKYSRKLHVYEVHLILPCKLCNRRYSTNFYLNKHLRKKHSDAENVTCEKCGETFATGVLLYKHNKKCLDISFACPFENCDKKYERKTALRAHMTIHSGKLPFICHVCGKGFTIPAALKRHVLQRHSTEKSWKCDQCTWAFATKGCLMRHMNTHVQDNQHKCHCGKAFANSWNLKAHARQHTGEKPYVCELCGAQFTHNVSRKNHMKIHTGGV